MFFFQVKLLYKICINSLRMFTSLINFWEVYIENLEHFENVAFMHANNKDSHKTKSVIFVALCCLVVLVNVC